MIDNTTFLVYSIMFFFSGVFITLGMQTESDLEVKAKAVIQVCEEHLPRDQHCELKAEPIRGKEQ